MPTRSPRAQPERPRPRSRGPPSVCAWSQATLLAGGATPQDPRSSFWGDPSTRPPRGDPSPQTPLGALGLQTPGARWPQTPGPVALGSAAVEGGAEQAERRGNQEQHLPVGTLARGILGPLLPRSPPA